MPPFNPIGPYRGVKPFEASGTGLPKRRGPQGQENKGDAGLDAFKLPKMSLQAFSPFGGQTQAAQEPIPIPDPVGPPQERPPVEQHKTVGGWFKNLYEDISMFAAAIPASFKVAYQAGKEILQNADYLDDIFIDQPELLTRELNRVGRQVIKNFTEEYRHGIGEAAYKHPFGTLLDLTGAFDMAGVAIKGFGKVALKAGAKTQAAELAKLGLSVQSFPGRMLKAPGKLALQALEKAPITGKIMNHFALTERGMAASKLLGTYLLEEKALIEPHAKALFGKRIKKKDRELYDDLLDGAVPLDEVANPAIRERYQEWQKGIMEDERLWKELGIFTPEEMEKAVLKQTALKLSAKGHFKGELYKFENGAITGFTDEAYDAARRWKAGENPWNKPTTPVYKQFLHERSLNLDELLDAMSAGEKSPKYQNYVSRFEKRTGASPIVLDPDVREARTLLQRGKLIGTVKFLNESVKRWGKPLKGGKADEGYKIISPMLGKYVERPFITAFDLLHGKIQERLRLAKELGGDRAHAIVDGIKATREELERMIPDLMKDVEDAFRNPAEWAIQVPDDVAYIIQKSVTGPRGALRVYDNMLDTWRDALLTFMPRYYVNNLLGNAVLLMFAGHNPMSKVAALKADDLPGEALHSQLSSEVGSSSSYIGSIWPEGQRGVRALANRLSEITDARARQVVLGTLAKEIVEEDAILGNATAQALKAMETAEEFQTVLFRARREFLGKSFEELRETRRLAAEAGGDFGKFREQAGLVGRAKYKLTERTLDPASQSRADSIVGEMMEIQRKMQSERQLSRMNPEASQAHLAELEQQLQMKVTQLEEIDPSVSLARGIGPRITRMPEISKVAEIQARRQALQPYAEIAEKVITSMEGFFGNYGRMHPLTREWVRRAIPFWTFTSTMFKLLFNLPFLRPKTSFLWHQFAKMMLDATGDDRLPSRFRDMIPVMGGEDGSIVFVRMGGWNPFDMASKTSTVGGMPIPKFMDPTSNPFVKVAVESLGGYDSFTEKPMTKVTDYVAIDGSIWRHDPELGRWEKVIPQKPLIASLFQQIPQTQVLGELLEAVGLPQVSEARRGQPSQRNPDGTLTYNRQWWHAIMRSAGMSVSSQDPARVERQHLMMKRAMAARYRGLARRADPTTRMQVETILRDLEASDIMEQ